MPLTREQRDVTATSFARSLLKRVGIEPNHNNLRAVVGWINAEGGHWHNTARHNPLNTTQPMPGAGNTGTQGNIKVYRNWRQGLRATAKTLQNGRYDGVLSALRGNDPQAVASAIDASPWGTHGQLIHSTIASAKLGPGGGRQIGVGSRRPAGTPRPPIVSASPGVDNSAARKALLANYLLSGQRYRDGGLLELKAGLDAAADVPGTTRIAKASAPSQPRRATRVSGSGGEAAVAYARSKLGRGETRGENRGRLPDRLNNMFGFGRAGAQPWCAMFTSLAVTKGGAPRSAMTAAVKDVRAKAAAKQGYRGFVDPRRAKAGDLILFGNSHIGMVERVTRGGIVMIAGNDSDTVQRRTVAFGSGDVVRPDYRGRR
jgi:hypothetical protein